MKLATFFSSSTNKMRISCRSWLALPVEIIAPPRTEALQGRNSLRVVTNHLAAFHNESYSLEFGDVLQRIAGNGNDIREFALFDGPYLVLPAHHFRCYNRGRLNGLARRHSVFHQVGELGRLRPVRERADPASK